MAMTITSTADDSLLNDIQKVIRSLRKKYIRIQAAEESQSNGKTINKEQQELLHSKLFILTDLHWFEKELDWLRKLSKERSSSSKNEGEVEESRDNERHLCVSYDSMIFCLDLKKCMDYSDNKLLPLPKISAHKFSERGNPVSMGLFKLGPRAYMVGGHRYKAYRVTRKSSRDKEEEERRWTYEVTLVDDKLCLSRCKSIRNLKKPKLWPTVEKIDNEIHVIESVPPEGSSPCPPIASHEVLRFNEKNVGVWTEVCPKFVPKTYLNVDTGVNDYHVCTWFHMVIGKRIYTSGSLYPGLIGIYDFGNNQWEMHGYSGYSANPHLYHIQHVGQLLSDGCGICVGKFLGGEDHVVIAIGKAEHWIMEAAAYLVTPTGQVLCYQRLPRFFGDVLQYSAFSRGTMFRVGEEGETVCAVVEGRLCRLRHSCEEPLERFLRVCTFTVEEGSGARTLVLDLGVQARRRGDGVFVDELPIAVEKDFVNIVVKDNYAFKLEDDDVVDVDQRMSACFL